VRIEAPGEDRGIRDEEIAVAPVKLEFDERARVVEQRGDDMKAG
jgi:hypothetical protein